MAILGIDEVGRGPWAGPLVVGAVVLPEEKPEWAEELRDSKKLSPKRREALNEVILAEATASGLGWVWQYEIDELGMTESLKLAAQRAIEELKKKHSGTKISEVIIDGNTNFLADTGFARRVTTVIKGDDLIKEISAASIIAKVARDRYMVELGEKYPGYGFELHKGYGTKQHISALGRFGATKEHRLSFRPLRKVLGMVEETESRFSAKRKSVDDDSTTIGQKAESVVAEALARRGYEIVARNYKNQLCEIDIIAAKGEKLYFVEVKYRYNDSRGGGLEAITATKKRQMEFAAKVFLANRPEFQKYEPRLAAAEVEGKDFRLKNLVILED